MITTSTHPALGAILVTEGLIPKAQLETVLAANSSGGSPSGRSWWPTAH